jgi:hypothetical protein
MLEQKLTLIKAYLLYHFIIWNCSDRTCRMAKCPDTGPPNAKTRVRTGLDKVRYGITPECGTALGHSSQSNQCTPQDTVFGTWVTNAIPKDRNKPVLVLRVSATDTTQCDECSFPHKLTVLYSPFSQLDTMRGKPRSNRLRMNIESNIQQLGYRVGN